MIAKNLETVGTGTYPWMVEVPNMRYAKMAQLKNES
jgi:hypothetical protein